MNKVVSSVAKHYSTFYDLGRKFGFKTAQIDEYLANGATATANGRVVTLAYDNHVITGRTKLGRSGRAIRWCRQFNKRAQESVNN